MSKSTWSNVPNNWIQPILSNAPRLLLDQHRQKLVRIELDDDDDNLPMALLWTSTWTWIATLADALERDDVHSLPMGLMTDEWRTKAIAACLDYAPSTAWEAAHRLDETSIYDWVDSVLWQRMDLWCLDTDLPKKHVTWIKSA